MATWYDGISDDRILEGSDAIIRALHSPWVTYWLHDELRREDSLTIIRARALVAGGLAVFAACLTLSIFLMVAVDVGRGLELALLGSMAIATLFLVRRYNAFALGGHLACALTFVSVFQAMVVYGGIYTPPARWAVFVPLFGLLFGGARMMLGWGAATVTALAALYLAPALGVPLPEPILDDDALRRLHAVSFTAQFVALVALFLISEAVRDWLALLARARAEIYELARDEALRANEAKSHFLEAITHELRTPLTTVIGYSEMLIEELEELEGVEWLGDIEVIHSSGTHLLGLVDDVLDLSRIESGTLALSLADTTPEAVVGPSVDAVRAIANERDNACEVVWASDEVRALAWHTDASRARQILVNLLTNAVTFTDGGKVTVHVSADDASVHLVVEDDGPGMSEELQAHAFELFVRGDNSNTGELGKMGMGLGVVYGLCAKLGGTVAIDSELGRGTRVELTLPRRGEPS